MLVLKRIRVHYRLKADGAARDVVHRVHGMHKEFCPVYRSIHKAIDVSTSLELV